MSARRGWVTGEWPTGPSRPKAPFAEVHVWRASVDRLGGGSARALALLCSSDEQVRAADIRDPVGRHRFLARRGLHRVLLGGYSVGNHRIELQTAVGHLGSDALFAFGRTRELGVSIQQSPAGDAALARTPGLTNRERLGLRLVAESERGRLACAVLAAKEAVGHARGRGLDRDLAERELLDVVAPVAGGGAFVVELDGLPWAGAILRIADDRIACVAHGGSPRILRTWSFANAAG